MKTWELRRIPFGPVVKVSFIVYFLLSLILFLVYGTFVMSILQSFTGFVGGEFDLPVIPGGLPLILLGLFISLMAALFYTVLTLVAVLLYNAVASIVGGVHLQFIAFDLDTESASKSVPAATEVPVPDTRTGDSSTEENQGGI